MRPRHLPAKDLPLPLDQWIGSTRSTLVGGLNAVPGFRTSAGEYDAFIY